VKKPVSIFGKILVWRLKHISDRHFVLILSALIGIITGLIAVVLKSSVHNIREFVQTGMQPSQWAFSYILYPTVGIVLSVLFIKYIIKKPIRAGIPNVLYGISRKRGRIDRHNMFSSIVTSSLTVGFGGSVGLEGPTVTTCSAVGSNLGMLFRLNYKQVTLLLACASAATIAAIFKAPIAALVFALEVIMLDLTMWSLIPLLTASMASVLTSYFFMGQDVLYPFQVVHRFQLEDIVWYMGLGIFCGIISFYFGKVYLYVDYIFKKIKNNRFKVLWGGICLGILLFIFPSLYGEGFNDINACLTGDYDYLFNNSIFFNYSENVWVLIILLLAVVLTKVIATSVTVGAGGVGGIFAPSLFIGVNAGVFYSLIINTLGLSNLNVNNFALIAMGGMIAGVLYAPLTGIFLIADISGGYHLFVPLMLTATISYATVRYFVPNSVYTIQLARRRHLMTHDKDKQVLSLMKVSGLIEKGFIVLHIDDSFDEIKEAISESSRNIFPVVDDDNNFKGLVLLDSIRKIMFNPELCKSLMVKDFLLEIKDTIDVDESMHDVASKFQMSGLYNIVVLEEGKYIGFVSRAKVFSTYRRMLKYFSED